MPSPFMEQLPQECGFSLHSKERLWQLLLCGPLEGPRACLVRRLLSSPVTEPSTVPSRAASLPLSCPWSPSRSLSSGASKRGFLGAGNSEGQREINRCCTFSDKSKLSPLLKTHFPASQFSASCGLSTGNVGGGSGVYLPRLVPLPNCRPSLSHGYRRVMPLALESGCCGHLARAIPTLALHSQTSAVS